MPRSFPSNIKLFDINSNDPQIIKFSGAKPNAPTHTLYGRCDVNGDGIDDTIIGSPGLFPTTSGQVHILFGPTTTDKDLANPGNNSVTINRACPNSRLAYKHNDSMKN